MGVPFDAVHTDFIELSKSLDYPVLLYQNKKGELFLDHDHGFFSPVKRFFYSLVGVRDYRLEKIVNTFASQKEAHSEPTAIKNLEVFCGKIARGCGIDDETFKKVLVAEKLLYNKEIPSSEREVAERFFASLSGDDKLQKKLGSMQAKLLTDLPEAQEIQAVLQRAQVTSRWIDLGLDLSLLNNDYQGAKFLVQNRLIYPIIGFQNSTASGPLNHEIKTDAEQKMMIKKQGSYVTVSQLSDEMNYDKKREELVTKTNPNEYWNYFSPDGLVPVDRWLHPEFVPVEQLSVQEMNQLRAHAKTFYPKGEEPKGGPPRDAVIQIFTNPRDEIPFGDFPLLSRFAASYPMHAAIRIITNDGQVYSTGFGANVEEYEYREKDFLATVNGVPTILDFEEFRKHEGRLVTSIPATSEACETILNTFREYREKTIRFNIEKQNCVWLAADALDQTGVKVNTLVTGADLLGKAAPSLEAFPLIGEPVGKIKKKITSIAEGNFDTTSSELLIGARLLQATFLVGMSARDALGYIPSKLGTLFSNIMVCALGGTTGSPLPKNKDEGAEILEKNGELKEFVSVVRNPLDFFKTETSTMYHALPLVQWQLQQHSTALHLYEGQPNMGILPPQMTLEKVQKTEEKHQAFTKKYLTNFGIV